MADAPLMPRWKVAIATVLAVAVAIHYFLVVGRSLPFAVGGGTAAGVMVGALFLALPTYLYRRFVDPEDRGRYITAENWRRGAIAAAVVGVVPALLGGPLGPWVFLVLAPPAAGVAQLISSNWARISSRPGR